MINLFPICEIYYKPQRFYIDKFFAGNDKVNLLFLKAADVSETLCKAGNINLVFLQKFRLIPPEMTVIRFRFIHAS